MLIPLVNNFETIANNVNLGKIKLVTDEVKKPNK